MEDTLHHLLLGTASSFRKKFFAKLKKSDLSSGQPKILDYLKHHNGCIQKDLAINCEVEEATVTSLLSRMEEAGLLERRQENNNRRSLAVYLTAKGKRRCSLIHSKFKELEDDAWNDFSELEKEQFLSMLKRLRTNISSK